MRTIKLRSQSAIKLENRKWLRQLSSCSRMRDLSPRAPTNETRPTRRQVLCHDSRAPATSARFVVSFLPRSADEKRPNIRVSTVADDWIVSASRTADNSTANPPGGSIALLRYWQSSFFKLLRWLSHTDPMEPLHVFQTSSFRTASDLSHPPRHPNKSESCSASCLVTSPATALVRWTVEHRVCIFFMAPASFSSR